MIIIRSQRQDNPEVNELYPDNPPDDEMGSQQGLELEDMQQMSNSNQMIEDIKDKSSVMKSMFNSVGGADNPEKLNGIANEFGTDDIFDGVSNQDIAKKANNHIQNIINNSNNESDAKIVNN